MSGSTAFKQNSKLTLGQMIQQCDSKLKWIPKEVLEEGLLRRFFGDRIIAAKERILDTALGRYCEEPGGKKAIEHLKKSARYFSLIEDEEKVLGRIGCLMEDMERARYSPDSETAAKNFATGLICIITSINDDIRKHAISMVQEQMPMLAPAVREQMINMLMTTKSDFDSEDQSELVAFDLAKPGLTTLDRLEKEAVSAYVRYLAGARIEEEHLKDAKIEMIKDRILKEQLTLANMKSVNCENLEECFTMIGEIQTAKINEEMRVKQQAQELAARIAEQERLQAEENAKREIAQAKEREAEKKKQETAALELIPKITPRKAVLPAPSRRQKSVDPERVARQEAPADGQRLEAREDNYFEGVRDFIDDGPIISGIYEVDEIDGTMVEIEGKSADFVMANSDSGLKRKPPPPPSDECAPIHGERGISGLIEPAKLPSKEEIKRFRERVEETEVDDASEVSGLIELDRPASGEGIKGANNLSRGASRTQVTSHSTLFTLMCNPEEGIIDMEGKTLDAIDRAEDGEEAKEDREVTKVFRLREVLSLSVNDGERRMSVDAQILVPYLQDGTSVHAVYIDKDGVPPALADLFPDGVWRWVLDEGKDYPLNIEPLGVMEMNGSRKLVFDTKVPGSKSLKQVELQCDCTESGEIIGVRKESVGSTGSDSSIMEAFTGIKLRDRSG